MRRSERRTPFLNGFLAEAKQRTVVQVYAMVLDLNLLTASLRAPFAVVANIPYYITTPLIQRLLSAKLPLSRLAVRVQKEVADKILSAPGQEGWGPLAILCQYRCAPYRAMDVPAECFTPVPKVDSTFLVLPVRDQPAVSVRSEDMFFRIVNAAFALRRKTMLNNLCATFRAERETAAGWLRAAGLDEKVRGEKLTLEELGRLADVMTESGYETGS